MKSKVASRGDVANQVREEDGGALEHSDEDNRLSGEIFADALCNLGDLRGNAIAGDERPQRDFPH